MSEAKTHLLKELASSEAGHVAVGIARVDRGLGAALSGLRRPHATAEGREVRCSGVPDLSRPHKGNLIVVLAATGERASPYVQSMTSVLTKRLLVASDRHIALLVTWATDQPLMVHR